MTIKLLCLTSTMESGGSERQMLQLLHRLDRNRFAARLYLTYGTGPLIPRIPPDVPLHAFAARQPKQPGLPGSIYLRQVRAVRKIFQRQQIAVSYDRLYHTAMVTAMAARRLKVRRVVTLVSPPSRDFGQSQQRWMGLKRVLLGFAYRSADYLIAVSDEAARDATDYYRIAADRWRLLPSPVDVAAVRRQAAEPPPANFTRGEGLNVAVVGRMSHEKNHRLMLQVIKDLQHRGRRDIKLHLVGDGPLRADLSRQVDEFGIADRVSFYGVLENPHAVLARCDVLCLPSLFEGFPNVVMEAIACNVPVVASESAGGLDVLLGPSGERGDLLPPSDASRWADRLATWPPQDSARRVAAASAYLLAKHDLAVWIERMQEIFCEAASNRVN